jgi:outer membrane protein TolC
LSVTNTQYKKGLVSGFVWLLSVACLIITEVHAQTAAALPVPLTLEFAIAAGTENSHPTLMAAQAEERVAEAELEEAESNYALESSVILTAGWVQPNDLALDQTHDDNIAMLSVRKMLYDFGVTDGRVGAAENLIMASKLEYEYARQHQVIDIARHYFDVLLADLKYTWDNESMAMRYVHYDRVKERHALQQVSDVELLQSENTYLTALTQRNASETIQRTSRALLAIAMNRPGELSASLARPNISTAARALDDLEVLVSAAVQNNLDMQAKRNRKTAARLDLDASHKRIRPTLDATLEVAEFSRVTPNRDDARARLNLVIPLNETGAARSEIAEKRAEWLQASADVVQLEARLRKQVAELWQQILQMQIRQQELQVAAARAALEFDKARGEYELEIRATLGDAMVNTSRVRYEQAKNEYEMALAWMQLYLATGKNPELIFNTGDT